MNDLDLCLEVVRSGEPLRHIRHWIPVSRKPLEIEVWFQFQRTINKKSPTGNSIAYGESNDRVNNTSHDPERSNSWPQYETQTADGDIELDSL